MFVHQSVTHPAGVSVLGTSLILVEPDHVVLALGISSLEPTPDQAFGGCREAAAKVREVLDAASIPDADVNTSALQLQQRWASQYSENARMLGYEATMKLSINVRDPQRYEGLLTAMVGAGANVVYGISFGTTSLAQHRVTARTDAIAKARQKAELYAAAAGVELGAPLHIEDVDPSNLGGREGHARTAYPTGDDGESARRPGAIAIGAAVQVCYAIAPGT
ncbi:hypothetical protein DB30_07282 [Enhygromyxa salina]|uniref:26 kDa periplasmic immunogenic protein n=1 Tax=Enhygromyxa salina TaxID=215803 RepID=A0A0C2CWU6_9BACT|nr:SIMPL domain-containing protein [Enhygromyxa salina]KIG14095.1 hypothetical protein DB30_07282 [Enhygromyxa salina]